MDPKNPLMVDSFQGVRYTPEELEYRDILITNAMYARLKRDTEHIEFDGMDYVTWWETNNKTRNGYIAPKKNESDITMTLGTVREKTNTYLAYLLNLNLEPNIVAYSKDGRTEIEVGEVMQDLEKKSREMEEPDYDYKKVRIYDEYLTQGTMFAEETFKEFAVSNHTASNLDMSKTEAIKITKGVRKTHKECDLELLVGLNVYLGNIREPSIDLQPYIFTRKLRTKEEASAIYGDWSRWKNVPLLKTDFFNINSDYRAYNNWVLTGFRENFVEEIKYYDKWSGNFMVMLNGTMMFPVKKADGKFLTIPLSSILGVNMYPVIKGDNEEMINFAYSRSVPSKTRVDQMLLDEFFKAMVFKTRQSYRPPMANFTSTQIGSDIFDPATIIDNVDPDKLKPIIPTPGVTNSEFNITQFVKQIIDEKSVNPVFEGQDPQGQTTATQIVEQRRASMQKMGLTVVGIVNFEKRRTLLRIYNILTHWTEAKEAKDGITQLGNKYRSITTDSKLPNGDGQRIVRFVGQADMPADEQVSAEENLTTVLTGNKVKINYIDPEELKKTIEWNWKISIVPTPKQDSHLKTAEFAEFIKNSLALSQAMGIQMKGQEVMTRYSTLSGEDADKLFTFGTPAIGQMPQTDGQMPQIQNKISQQLSPRQLPQPSVNSLVKG